MAKRNDPPKELVKAGGTDMSWLGGHEADASLEAMKEYRILPRLKVIQAMSAQDLKNDFGEGSVILSPGNALLFDNEGAVDFVAVFFFTEFLKIADRDDTNSPMILARSFDKAGELAMKARHKDKRFEPYGEKEEFTARYAEVLNFPGFIVSEDHEQRGTPMVLGFSRGEFSKGRQFINAITLRKVGGKSVPVWAQRWTISSGFRERGAKKWWGIDFQNPELPENLYIKQDEAEFFKAQASEMKDLFEKSRLSVDMSDTSDERSTPDADDKM